MARQVRVRHLLHQRGMARRRGRGGRSAVHGRLARLGHGSTAARGRGHARHDTAIATRPLQDLCHGGPAPHQVRGTTRDEGGVRQGASRLAPVLDGPIDRGLGDAQLHHAVRIRRGGAGQGVRVRERRRHGVGIPVGSRVVDLDVIHGRGEGVEAALLFRGAAAARRAEPVERVRQADEAPLLVDRGRGLRGRSCRAARPARGTGR